MAIIKVNWIYLEMVGTFNAIKRSVRMYQDHEDTIHNRVISDIRQEIESSTTLSNVEEVFAEELQLVNYHFANTYPRIQAYSAIVLTYSAVEYWLERICKRIRIDRNLPVGVRDFTGTLTEKFSKFAKTFELCDIPSAHRTLIENLRLIRNCIVHTDGRIAESKASTKLRKLVRREKGLGINEDGALTIEIDKALELVDSSGKAVASLYKAWNLGDGIEVEE
jgi:hypothetical protein